jgi:hypothetical protein
MDIKILIGIPLGILTTEHFIINNGHVIEGKKYQKWQHSGNFKIIQEK